MEILYCILSLVILHMVVIYFFFLETKGLGLEEIAQIFGNNISDLMIEADNAIIEPSEHELRVK